MGPRKKWCCPTVMIITMFSDWIAVIVIIVELFIMLDDAYKVYVRDKKAGN